MNLTSFIIGGIYSLLVLAAGFAVGYLLHPVTYKPTTVLKSRLKPELPGGEPMRMPEPEELDERIMQERRRIEELLSDDLPNLQR